MNFSRSWTGLEKGTLTARRKIWFCGIRLSRGRGMFTWCRRLSKFAIANSGKKSNSWSRSKKIKMSYWIKKLIMINCKLSSICCEAHICRKTASSSSSWQNIDKFWLITRGSCKMRSGTKKDGSSIMQISLIRSTTLRHCVRHTELKDY